MNANLVRRVHVQAAGDPDQIVCCPCNVWCRVESVYVVQGRGGGRGGQRENEGRRIRSQVRRLVGYVE
jgi:hypothetical protein